MQCDKIGSNKYSWNVHWNISIYILRYHICFKSKENLATVYYSYIDVVTEKPVWKNQSYVCYK